MPIVSPMACRKMCSSTSSSGGALLDRREGFRSAPTMPNALARRLDRLEQERAGGRLWFVFEAHDDFPDREADIERALSEAGETAGPDDNRLIIRRFGDERRTPARFLYKFQA